MKKSKLIAILNEIEGDPDIMLWNGLVGDWNDLSVDLTKSTLVKMTKAYYIECSWEKACDNADYDAKLTPEEIAELNAMWSKVCKWEHNRYVTQEDIAKKRYSAKSVYFIDAKVRGKTTFDRLGSIQY